MSKNKFKLIGIFLVVLFFSLILVMNTKKIFSDSDYYSVEYNVVSQFDDYEKKGLKNVDNNPWGANLCRIVLENGEDAILLTPSTGFLIKGVNGEKVELYFKYGLYSQMVNISDGANLIVQIFDEVGNMLYINKLSVPKNGEQKIFKEKIDLKLDKLYSISISCDNGETGDDSGDWVVLTDARLFAGELLNTKENVFPEYIKGVHYFGDEWPINFWNTELNDLDKDFLQIKEDGFNTIVLVIPWREFQPGIDPINYNNYAFNMLDKIMSKARDYDLYVEVRIGYTWDFFEDKEIASDQRFYDVLKKTEVRTAWLNYADKLYEELEKYENFIGGFITWEDFWNNTYLMDYLNSKDERVLWAMEMGFQQFLSSQYLLDDFNEEYNTNFSDFSEVYIPERSELFAKEYYRFFDDYMVQLLEETQTVFPGLSMEVRTDWDAYGSSEERLTYQHSDTFSCGNSGYTSIMYGIPQGWENVGERVTYREAMEKTDYILKNILPYNGNKPIFIDQFLFADNTPGYENNAQIIEDQVGAYLENIPEVLKKYSCGYALWTYKDYVSNLIYNPQFAIESNGWTGTGYEICDSNYGKALRLFDGGNIFQKIPTSRNHFPNDVYTMEFDVVNSEENAELVIRAGADNEQLAVTTGHYSLELQPGEKLDIEFIARGELTLDNIKFYTHIQNGYLYGRHEKNIKNIESIRKMNDKL